MSDFIPPLSPAEVVQDLITRFGQTVGFTVPATGQVVQIIVGPATDAQQQAGVISLMAAGLPMVEKYIPLMWHRAQVRCLGPDLDTADQLSQRVQADIHGVTRKLCYQASNDSWYLVHLCNVEAGPSMHYDSPETWETLLFAELMISSDPVGHGVDSPL